MAEVTFDVRQPIRVLSSKESGWKKEINVVSWNKRPPKLDIREWNADRSKMKKGITLNREEALLLRKTLEEMDYSILPEWVSFMAAAKEYAKGEAIPEPKPDISDAVKELPAEEETHALSDTHMEESEV